MPVPGMALTLGLPIIMGGDIKMDEGNNLEQEQSYGM